MRTSIRVYLAHSEYERDRGKAFAARIERDAGCPVMVCNPFYPPGRVRPEIERLDAGERTLGDFCSDADARMIVDADLSLLETCDILVALLPQDKASVGTSCEMFFAWHDLDIPVLCSAGRLIHHSWVLSMCRCGGVYLDDDSTAEALVDYVRFFYKTNYNLSLRRISTYRPEEEHHL